MISSDPVAGLTAKDAVAWTLEAADDALDTGFSAIAARLYSDALRSPALSPSAYSRTLLQLASALISEARFEDALAALHRIENRQLPALLLRQAMLDYQMGDWKGAESGLSQLSVEALDGRDRAWFFLVVGLIEESKGHFEKAIGFYERAKAESVSTGQRAEFESILFRVRLLSGLPGPPDESLVVELRAKVEAAVGQAVGFQYAKVYAVVLDLMGQREDAMDVIEEQLRIKAVQEGDQEDQFLLLLGLISTESTVRGREALRTLLTKVGNIDLQRVALHLLARRALVDAPDREFDGFLNDLIDRPTKHVLLDELYFFRAYLSLYSGQYGHSEADATRLLDLFPGSSFKANAIRLLAFVSWQWDPPRYRTAADYLRQLREHLPDGRERARAAVLMADCYYLNGDFRNAASAYGTALMEADTGSLDKGPIVFQKVMAEIYSGNLESAIGELNRAGYDPGIDPLRRWRAEWNLINQMKVVGRVEEAFDRVVTLLRQSEHSPIPSELRLRLMWLRAQLSIEADQPGETPALADGILSALASIPGDEIGSEQRGLIISHTLLLRGQALFAINRVDEGLATFHDLARRFPASEPTSLSYLIEARYNARIGNLVLAQQRLIELVDDFPASKYSPIAFWEAAQYAEDRRELTSDSGALKMLGELIQRYPEHELVYYARLKQADLSRELNEFGAAQLIYEELINQFPVHPDRYRAELSRADCLLAQASQSSARLDDAVTVFQRLMDLPNLPVDLRVEAGFKWGYGVAKMKNESRAQEVFMLTLNRFLKDPERAVELGSRGRYWQARLIFELGELLEKEKRFEEAERIYDLVPLHNLPGRSLAEARIAKFSTIE